MKTRIRTVSMHTKLNIEELELRTTPALTVRFDYSFDLNGFFNDPSRRAALQQAADEVTSRITDRIGEIRPGGVNSWTVRMYDSAIGNTRTVNNIVVNADEIVVYVSSGNIGNALAIASGGGYSSSGTSDFIQAVRTRGEAGAANGTDFSTWGGLIAFSTQYNFNFAGNPSSTEYDFRATAEHELRHILGFGLNNPSFTRYTSTGSYTGTNVVSLLGKPAPMESVTPPDHFAQGFGYQGTESIMVPALNLGVAKRMTELEYAVLRDIGWDSSVPVSPPVVPPPPVSPPVAPPPVVVPPVVPPPPVVVPPVVPPPPVVVPPVVPPPPVVNAKVRTSFLTGYDAGGLPRVASIGKDGTVLASGLAFSSFFRGGVRTATADVNGDGVDDYILGAGPGAAPFIRIVDGRTNLFTNAFFAFDTTFRNGVYVAGGDVNGDGRADIAVSVGNGPNAKVRVFSGLDTKLLAEISGFGSPDATGTPQIAMGDVNGDGVQDLVVATGAGAASSVSVWDGRSIGDSSQRRLSGDFTAFSNKFTGGASVAITDVDGDGFGDIVLGKGAGDTPTVDIISGASLIQKNVAVVLYEFNGSSIDYRGGVRVAAADIDGDGREDIIVAPGANSDGTIRVFSTDSLSNDNPTPFRTIASADWARFGALVG